MNISKEVTLLRPDISLANRIKIMFASDTEVSADFEESKAGEPSKLILSVRNEAKAAALRKLLPESYTEISPILEIEVKDTSSISGDTVVAAFQGNPHFRDYIEIEDPLSHQTFHVCIFKDEVIKFPNDNGGSLHGYEFRLMQDLAVETMSHPQLIYTTDDGLPYDPVTILNKQEEAPKGAGIVPTNTIAKTIVNG